MGFERWESARYSGPARVGIEKPMLNPSRLGAGDTVRPGILAEVPQRYAQYGRSMSELATKSFDSALIRASPPVRRGILVKPALPGYVDILCPTIIRKPLRATRS
jgi:hypothetical protein